MGLKSFAKKAAGAALLPITGPAQLAGKLGKKAFGSAPEEPKPPEIDPRFKQLAENASSQASGFRSRMPAMAEEAQTANLGAARRQLAGGLADVRSGYNQRGLLYSGLRQGAEADVVGESAARLAAARRELNQGLEDQAFSLDANAADAGLRAQGMESESMDSALERALARAGEKRKAIAGLGEAGGSLIGTSLASNKV
jgi:hypothetical protein